VGVRGLLVAGGLGVWWLPVLVSVSVSGVGWAVGGGGVPVTVAGDWLAGSSGGGGAGCGAGVYSSTPPLPCFGTGQAGTPPASGSGDPAGPVSGVPLCVTTVTRGFVVNRGWHRARGRGTGTVLFSPGALGAGDRTRRNTTMDTTIDTTRPLHAVGILFSAEDAGAPRTSWGAQIEGEICDICADEHGLWGRGTTLHDWDDLNTWDGVPPMCALCEERHLGSDGRHCVRCGLLSAEEICGVCEGWMLFNEGQIGSDELPSSDELVTVQLLSAFADVTASVNVWVRLVQEDAAEWGSDGLVDELNLERVSAAVVEAVDAAGSFLSDHVRIVGGEAVAFVGDAFPVEHGFNSAADELTAVVEALLSGGGVNAYTRAVLARGTCDADVRHVVLTPVGPVGAVAR
jgi:hypothetical protein